ncbi:MAG: protein kinase domain-containing protein [Planctomycetota bacterium]
MTDAAPSSPSEPPKPADSHGTAAPNVQVFNNRYRVLGRLGKGGLGEVLLAFDEETRREVALKIMRGDLSEPRRRRRFFAEAVISAQLQHPGIVPIYTIHSDEHFYTMRPISGNSLGRILRLLRRKDKAAGDSYPLSRLLDILIQVAQAVGYAHHRGVVHGDLKPHNIMIGDYGEVLTLDWGLARLPKHLPADIAPASALRVDALVQSTLSQSASGATVDDITAPGEVTEADTVELFDRHETADSSRLGAAGAGSARSSISARSLARGLSIDSSGPVAPAAGGEESSSELPLGRAHAAARPSGALAAALPHLGHGGAVRLESSNERITLPESMQPDKHELIAGTPAYMAPEVISGHPPDYASDVYALGVTLYECLTLQKLHTGADMQEIIASVKAGQIRPPHKVAPERRIPLELSRICMTALAQKSRNRPASALELAQQLKKFRDGRTNWHLIYRENFLDRPKPGSWEQVEGKWRWDVEGLGLEAHETAQGVLHFIQACPRDLRVEVEGLVLPDEPGELSILMSAKPPVGGNRRTNGYCFQFGANYNVRSKIAKDDVDVVVDPTTRYLPGVVHTLVAERRGDLLRLLVDDEVCLEYRDMVPLSGPRVGLYTYGSGARVHRISIYGGGISETVSCLAVPDDYFNTRKFEEAQRRYLTIADAMSDTETGLIARFKAGLCGIELGDLPGALSHFARLSETFYQGYCHYGQALVAARQKDMAGETAALRQALESKTPEAREIARLMVWERMSQLMERGQMPDHVMELLKMARERLRKRDHWQYNHHAAMTIAFLLRDFRFRQAEELMDDLYQRGDLYPEMQISLMNEQAAIALGECRYDDLLKMTREFETEMVLNPQTQKYLLVPRVRALVYSRRFEAAYALLDAILARGNLSPLIHAQVLLYKADGLFQNLRPASAWQLMERAVSMFQNVTVIRAMLIIAQVNVAIRLGRYRAALQLLKRFPDGEMGSHRVEENNLILAGLAWSMLNDPRRALQSFRQVLMRNPDKAHEVLQTALLRSAIVSVPLDPQQAQRYLEQADAQGDIGVNGRVLDFLLGRRSFDEVHGSTAPVARDILCYYVGEWELAHGRRDKATEMFLRAANESPLPFGWIHGQARVRLEELGRPLEPLAFHEAIPAELEALEANPPT